jgi:hypothetical protein
MTRIRLILLSVFAVIAVSAVASASASAACSKETGTGIEFCLEHEDVNSGFPKFTSVKEAGTESELKVENGPIIKCTVATNTFSLDAGGSPSIELFEGGPVEVSDLEIVFKTCKVTNTVATEENCEVKEPISVNGGGDELDGTFNGPPINKVTIKPSEGNLFVAITIKTKTGRPTCPFAATGNVTGEQTCNVPNIETENTVHKLECAASGSNLKAFSKNATFTLKEEVKYTEPTKNWSIVES